MDFAKKKLDVFTEELLHESNQNIRQIIEDVETKQNAALTDAETEIEKEAEAYVKKRISEIKSREGRRISAHLLESKRKLFVFREQCAHEIFEEVHRKIDAFTSSPAYGGHLEKLFSHTLDVLGYGASITVTLRPEDMKYEENLANAAHGVSLAFQEGEILLGGLSVRCPSKNLYIDFTFDTALRDVGNHFAELSGIDLE